MKYSQIIQEQIPVESRQLNFNNNVPVNRPLQNNYQFNSPTANQNIPTNLVNRNVN